MGYSTDFYGSVTFNKPITEELKNYINKFGETRRMKRDVEKIKKTFPDWEKNCFNGNLGVDGEYFVGGNGFMGQDRDDSIVDYNYPPETQPGLWCQWMIDDDGNLVWDGGEKFYEYGEWLTYLIENFLAPSGYVCNGEIEFQGEDMNDFGTIYVKDNVVTVEYGMRIQSLEDISDDDLIAEAKRRGFKIVDLMLPEQNKIKGEI